MALIRSSSQFRESGAVNVTITTPSGAASGDILIAHVVADSGSSFPITSDSADWTDGPEANGAIGSRLFYQELTSSPDANYTFLTNGASTRSMVTMIAIDPNGETFVGFGTPTGVYEASDTDGVTDAVTGQDDPSVLVCGFVADDLVTVATAPSGMVENEIVSGGTSLASAMYSEIDPGTGSLVRTIVWSATTQIGSFATLLEFSGAAAGGLTPRSYPRGASRGVMRGAA